jgi:hypothetical protein
MTPPPLHAVAKVPEASDRGCLQHGMSQVLQRIPFLLLFVKSQQETWNYGLLSITISPPILILLLAFQERCDTILKDSTLPYSRLHSR